MKLKSVTPNSKDPFFNNVKIYFEKPSADDKSIASVEHLSFSNGILLYYNHIYIPECLRFKILCSCHDSRTSGNFGINKTSGLVSRNYWWPGMYKDIKKYFRSCNICCASKVPRH